MKKFLNLATATILLVVAFRITPKPPTERFSDVATKVLPSCVSLSLDVSQIDEAGVRRYGRIGGSGVFISPKGYLLTCAHVVNFETISLINVELYNGDVVAGHVVMKSKNNDLALIKVDFFKEVAYAKLADPRTLKVGQEVVAIGAPLGLTFTVTSGIISALYRDIDDSYNVTQSDVAINPGNSGGPLFNLKGELVGINSFMISANPFLPVFTGLGFSVQCGQCYEFLLECARLYSDLQIKHFKLN
jgi:putative serine protease PepD